MTSRTGSHTWVGACERAYADAEARGWATCTRACSHARKRAGAGLGRVLLHKQLQVPPEPEEPGLCANPRSRFATLFVSNALTS